MSQQSIYQAWINSGVMGKQLDPDGVKADTGQCSQVDISYGEALFPGVPWYVLFPPTANAKDMFTNYNPTYFEQIVNDHNDPNQLPEQGDIMFFGATPADGYVNSYYNPAGHTGICDSASASGFALTQENAPATGEGVNTTNYAWKFRPCEGWLRPKVAADPTPAPSPTPSSLIGREVWLHAVPQWHVYRVGTQPILTNAIGYLVPQNYDHGPSGQPGLTYEVLGVSQYPNTVTIQTDTYGNVDIYLDGDAQIL